MEQLGFFDRLKNLFSIISSSSFFIILGIVFLLTFVLLIINVKTKKKIIKIITASIYGIIVFLIFIKYINPILMSGDSLIEKVFTAIYFPNFISYICMMIITTFLIIFIILNKKISSFGKYISVIFTCFIVFLFILTLDTIVSGNINIYEKTSLYSNDTLIVLIQSSTIVFALWMIIMIINLIVNIIAKKQEQKEKEIFNRLRVKKGKKLINQEEVVEEPKLIDDVTFNNSLKKLKAKNYNKNINLDE